ncbi:MAG TPA: VIT domain-containing protein [Pseudomonadales bacterium]|nr:VIT domain-containing protein [Pseudomonadales bacterium]
MGTMEQAAGGMFVRSSQAPVPLTGVSIEVTGSGSAAEVCVRQRFVNVERVPIEAVYSFPLEEGSAVCELVMETGGKRLLGRIEEREKAFEQYDEALAAGHGAFLADQDRPNIFTISAGNLLPGQEATVCLRYATELEQHGGELRIMLPTTISPRYVPADMLGSADPAELERINPPTVLGRVPYGLSLTVDYTAPQGVKSVSCASHPAQVSIDGNRVRVELMGTDVQLDRDFVVNIALAQPFAPHAVVAQDGPEECAVMINLFPDPGRFARQPGEYIFLLDRSGSMAGGSIAQALDALCLALRSMEAGDAFNIIGFGSRHEMMFPHSQPYTQASLDQATRALESWDANMGGTELLAPLQAALAAKAGELPRQFMLLTDGQVSNEAACIAAVAAHAGSVRMFTFGIGHGASEFLVRGLARACGGKAEFIHPNERIEPVVMRQFARAAAPFLRNVRVDWGGLAPNLVAPAHIGSLFAGDRLTAYARVPAGDPAEPVEVAVLADGPQGTMRFPVRVDLRERVDDAMSGDAGSGSSGTFHRGSGFSRTIVRMNAGPRAVPALMARAAIRELEEGRGAEREAGSNQRARRGKGVDTKVLELALRYQLLSSQTSFVAVEERSAGEQAERAQLRRVPVALTHGWGGSDRLAMSASHSLQPMADMGIRAMFSRSASPRPAASDAPLLPGMSASVMEYAAIDMHCVPELIASFDAPASSRTQRTTASKTRAAPDAFMLLTLSQRADGSFRLEPEALRAFALDANALARAAALLGGGDRAEAMVHTAVALALLERRFGDRQDEWRMLADKAARWMAGQAVALPAGETSWAGWAGVACAVG